MGLFVPGIPRLAVLNSSGVKLSTFYLPMPDKGLPEVEWVEKGILTPLPGGGESLRRFGWIPQLTFRWSIYLDRVTASFTEGVTAGAWGITIGPNNGNMPSISDLMVILSNGPGLLSVSPGPSAGGFVAQSWKIKPIKTNPLGQAEGLEITFRGGTPQSSMVLGAF